MNRAPISGIRKLVMERINEIDMVQDYPVDFGNYLDFYTQLQRLSISEKEEIGKFLINLTQMLKPDTDVDLLGNLIKENARKLRAKEERADDIAESLNYIYEMLNREAISVASADFTNRNRFKVKPEM